MHSFVGAYSLSAAMNMLGFLETVFEASVDVRQCAPLHRSAKWWRQERAGEPRRAPPLPKSMIEWLEETILGDSRSRPAHLVARTSQIQLGASLRHDDLRRMQFYRVELMRTADSFFRGIRMQAAETNTHARFWVCRAEQTMPDTYLRESQALSLDCQVEVIRFLRSCGEVMPSTLSPPRGGASGVVAGQADHSGAQDLVGAGLRRVAQ